MLSTPIIQLIDRDPVSIDIGQKLSDAFRILLAGRIHHLPVVSNDVLVGMLSTSDMLELKSTALIGDDAASAEYLDRYHTIESAMSKDVLTVSHRATVADAARQLSAGGFHSLPVVDQDNSLVGIVTTTDLIRHILEAPPKPDLPDNLKRQMQALERVRKAAQAFLHSGMAATEHQKLERALEAARGITEVL
jgi:CBS-domain-containing membrane protein